MYPEYEYNNGCNWSHVSCFSIMRKVIKGYWKLFFYLSDVVAFNIYNMHKTVEKGRHTLITNKCSSNFTKCPTTKYMENLDPILKKYPSDERKTQQGKYLL